MEFVVAGISQQDPKPWAEGEKNLSCCIHPNLENDKNQEKKGNETDGMRLADSQYYLAIQSWASLVCLCSSPGLTKALLRKYVGMWVFSWDFLRKVLISTIVWLSLPFWFSLVMQLGFISKEFTTDKELLHFFTRCKYPFCQHCRWFACNWVTPASAVYGELCSWFGGGLGPSFSVCCAVALCLAVHPLGWDYC